jgi:hypothetical protein
MIEIALDVRTINQAAEKNRSGGGPGVYCTLADKTIHRIVQAKTVRGQLVAHRLNDGHWVYPVAVYKEW